MINYSIIIVSDIYFLMSFTAELKQKSAYQVMWPFRPNLKEIRVINS